MSLLPYGVSIFLSACLVFLIQPTIARTILPWFGGAPAVWSSVILFFQALLTAGYAYAYWLTRRIASKRQTRIHLVLILGSLLVLIALGFRWPSPVTPDAAWRPAGADWPVARILMILVLAVGLPYFVLATNSPLMQAWSARVSSGRSPYWLYALSNTGSLIGVIGYPLFVEPSLSVRGQGWAWTCGYVLFAAVTSYGTVRAGRQPSSNGGGDGAERPVSIQRVADPPLVIQILWVGLSATGSVLLLAVTSHITQEVAVIPLLWILPLAAYLLTFILTFSGEKCYHRPLFSLLLLLASVAGAYVTLHIETRLTWQIAAYLTGLFVACMIAHGELYRLRPDPAHLTRYYLVISLGGALGGLLVNLVAPALFSGYWELYIGWAVVWLLLAGVCFVRPTTELPARWRLGHDAAVGGLAVTVTGLVTYSIVCLSTGGALRERNFYGVLRVQQDDAVGAYTLVHGATIHGTQLRDPALRRRPTMYYWRGSGIGLALVNHARHSQGMRVGVLGLGVGTLAAYCQPGDVYRFYEINPLVVRIAYGQGGYFSFLRESLGDVRVVLGDARLSLERELAAGDRQRFDVLALDVFSSDAIPVHLVTREAFGLYLEHLAPGGVIAANISNRHLDLTPVFWRIAQEYGLEIASISVSAPVNEAGAASSVWILLARDHSVFMAAAIREKGDRLKDYATRARLWTDDYSNLFQLLK
jgi:hypothetical protein